MLGYTSDDLDKMTACVGVAHDAIKNNEDLTLYFEEQDRAKHAPTFELQQFELNKLRYPFEPEKIIQDKQYILNEPSHIIIKNRKC